MLRLLTNRFFHSLLVILALICSAHGGYFLYWTAVDSLSTTEYLTTGVKAVALYLYDNQNPETRQVIDTLTANDINPSVNPWLKFNVSSTLEDGSSIVSDSTGRFSFYVNLYDENNTLIFDGYDYNITAAAALSEFISTNLYPANDQQYWMPNLSVTPEPSSGLMILIGLSFLALRRRKCGESHKLEGGCL